MKPKFLLDEHLDAAIQRQLRRLDFRIEVLRIGDDHAPPRGTYDPGILTWAAEHDFIVITRDRSTMPTFVADRITQSQKFAGFKEPIFSYNQTDFIKERVAVEVQFGKYAFVAYDLFVKHLAFYVRDEIDVGIEILAMKSLQSQMSSGPGYYEGELYNVIRNGRGVPGVPLVIIGVAP